MPEYEVKATNLPGDPFVRAYLECAEWAGLSEEDEAKLERAAAPRWSADAIKRAKRECQDFCSYCERGGFGLTREEYADPMFGHDFYLTRNGHGAGFWDRGYGERGDKLSDAAKTFGEASVYFHRTLRFF